MPVVFAFSVSVSLLGETSLVLGKRVCAVATPNLRSSDSNKTPNDKLRTCFWYGSGNLRNVPLALQILQGAARYRYLSHRKFWQLKWPAQLHIATLCPRQCLVMNPFQMLSFVFKFVVLNARIANTSNFLAVTFLESERRNHRSWVNIGQGVVARSLC